MFEQPKNEQEIIEQMTIDKIYEKAKKLFKKYKIELNEFKDLYGNDTIKKDEGYVKNLKKEFVKKNSPEQEEINKLATIFEAILYEHSELSNWLGENASTIKTSSFDDIANGVDSVVEFNEEEGSSSHLGLAIDATFSNDIRKKIQRIKKEIEQGELAKIKYFKSEKKGFRGELSQIPRVIIGANVQTIKELGELWIENENKKLGKHTIQFQILDQILIQLETFEKYANKVNQPEIAEIYNKAHKLILEIYEKKEELIDDSGERDSMYDDIVKAMDNFDN